MLELKFNIDPMKVRRVCIDNEYYTYGDCKAYTNMFAMCEDANSKDDILKIAADIAGHSNHDQYDWQEFIDNIAFLIINKCCTYFFNDNE